MGVVPLVDSWVPAQVANALYLICRLSYWCLLKLTSLCSSFIGSSIITSIWFWMHAVDRSSLFMKQVLKQYGHMSFSNVFGLVRASNHLFTLQNVNGALKVIYITCLIHKSIVFCFLANIHSHSCSDRCIGEWLGVCILPKDILHADWRSRDQTTNHPVNLWPALTPEMQPTHFFLAKWIIASFLRTKQSITHKCAGKLVKILNCIRVIVLMLFYYRHLSFSY